MLSELSSCRPFHSLPPCALCPPPPPCFTVPLPPQEAAHLISLRLASLEGQSKVHVYVVQELVSELRSLVCHTPTLPQPP